MSVVNLESLLTCIATAGVSYAFIADEKRLLDILFIGAVYGFVSFLLFLLLHTAYPSLTGRIDTVLVSMAYVVVMYRSNPTEMMTTKRAVNKPDK